MRGSRSSLRRIGVPYVGRKRWYLLRLLFLALIVAVILVFLFAVQTQYFAKSGVGAAIYGIHDSLYLWAKGESWIRFFPYALVWLVPLAVALGLVIIEFGTPLDPIRALHRRLILTVVTYRWAQAFLARPLGKRQINSKIWLASLTPNAKIPPRWFGFARRVVRRAQENTWRRMAVGLVAGTPIAPRQAKRLALLSGMRLRFDPSDGVGHLRALEVIAVTQDQPETQKLSQRMADFYAAQDPADSVAPLATALEVLRRIASEDVSDATAEFSKLSSALQSITNDPLPSDLALQLACQALVAHVVSWRCRLPEITQYQRLWVKSRLIADPKDIAEAIETAEGLIFFELWSKLAEIAPTPLAERSLLALALGSNANDISGLMGAPEHYAWTGTTR